MPIVEIKRVDSQGRVLLPSAWRKMKLGKRKEVYVISLPDRVEIIPMEADLSRFIDSVEVEIPEGKFLDPHELKRELRRTYAGCGL